MSLAYAELKGLILDERLTYKDLGVSAYDKSNVRAGQLGVFLKAVEEGLVPIGSYLLVESLDRISRAKITEALEIFMAIINRGIILVTLADGFEYSKEKIDRQFTDIIISIAIMSRAHEESLMKSKRIKAAWVSKRANVGLKKLTSIAPGWLELSEDKSEYLQIPNRVKLVQEIFESTKNGIGTGTISTRLNQQNVPTFGMRSKNTWHNSYLQKIIHNRSVLGEFQPHTLIEGKRVPLGDPIPDYFPRIISDELFTLAHAARQTRKVSGAGRKGSGLSNLFSGLLRCGYCKGSMVYVNKGRDEPKSKFLVCSTAKAGKQCVHIPWQYDHFEKSVLAYCRGLDLDNFLQLSKSSTSEIAELADKILLIKSSIDAIKNKEANILSAVENGADFQPFKVRAKQLEHERIQLEIELQAAQKMHEIRIHAKVDIQTVRSNLDEFLSQMDQLTGEELYNVRSALSQQVKRIVTRIAMCPGGYIQQPTYISALRHHLQNEGHSPKEIQAKLASELKSVSKPKERFFIMASPTGSIRIIQPNKDNPEVLHLIADGDNVAENLELQMERTAEVIEQIKALPALQIG